MLFGFTYPDSGQQISAAEVTASADTMTINGTTYEVAYSYTDVIYEYYLDFIGYCEGNAIAIKSVYTYEKFSTDFYGQDIYTISEYTAYLKGVADEHFKPIYLGIRPMGTSPNHGWQVGIGDILPPKPNYQGFLFNLLPGDIIYEHDMAWVILAYYGHTSIVEGNFYDSVHNVYYWRVIEAMNGKNYGVVRSVMDSDRFVANKGYVLRVFPATEAQRNEAVSFAISQLGKGYTTLLMPWDRPWNSDTTKEWMCSTLVWAAYRHQNNGNGIDIDPNGGAIMPKDILDSAWTATIESYDASLGDGQLIRVTGNNEIYIMAGGAPLYVSSWNNIGGARAFRDISDYVFGTLLQYPKDGTFVRDHRSDIYVFAGGAPLYVSAAAWPAWFAGTVSFTDVDGAALETYAETGKYSHVRQYPLDGTMIRGGGGSTGTIYIFAGGFPFSVSSWDAVGGYRPFTVVDSAVLLMYSSTGKYGHVRQSPLDDTLVRAGAGAVASIYIYSAGFPFGVSSWESIGGYRPFTIVDPAAILSYS